MSEEISLVTTGDGRTQMVSADLWGAKKKVLGATKAQIISLNRQDRQRIGSTVGMGVDSSLSPCR